MTNKSRIEIPKTSIFGVPIEGAMERVLAEKQEKPEQETQNRTAPNVEGMVYVPEAGIYFAKKRTHLNEDWNQTHLSLASEKTRMPTIEEFRKSLKYFKTSKDRELQTLYDEIAQVKSPWRANWLDAYFEKRKDGLYVLTGNKTKPEKMEACLMSDKTPGINLESWLSNATSQGLPKPEISDGDLYYWHPLENRVARFSAGSDWADLDCNWGPDDRFSDLGVFAVADNKP